MRRKRSEIIVIDGREAFYFEPRHLLPIVDDVSQAIKRTFLKFAFGRLDSTRHTKAETTVRVNVDPQFTI